MNILFLIKEFFDYYEVIHTIKSISIIRAFQNMIPDF